MAQHQVWALSFFVLVQLSPLDTSVKECSKSSHRAVMPPDASSHAVSLVPALFCCLMPWPSDLSPAPFSSRLPELLSALLHCFQEKRFWYEQKQCFFSSTLSNEVLQQWWLFIWPHHHFQKASFSGSHYAQALNSCKGNKRERTQILYSALISEIHTIHIPQTIMSNTGAVSTSTHSPNHEHNSLFYSSSPWYCMPQS